jgi:N-acetylglucosamine kinase-like BadF-type ATPase
VSDPVIMAVDGGNSKTDLALVATDGSLIAFVRGAGCSPHRLGTAGCIELIGELLGEARAQAGRGAGRYAAAVLLVAGADLEREVQELRRLADGRGWADTLSVGNDTLALLHAGSETGIGVAVVCGAGINALGVAPDGRQARFPALGTITGDWGGGGDLGLAALGKAVRAGDGRGRPTELAQLIPAHFGLAGAEDVAFAIHRREIDPARLVELAPIVLDAADSGDAPARELRDRLAAEIVSFVRAAAGRVLSDLPRFDVVLGGSVLARADSLAEQVIGLLAEELPEAEARVCKLPPVAGSALIGLELMGAGADAAQRLREAMREHSLTPGGTLQGPRDEART